MSFGLALLSDARTPFPRSRFVTSPKLPHSDPIELRLSSSEYVIISCCTGILLDTAFKLSPRYQSSCSPASYAVLTKCGPSQQWGFPSYDQWRYSCEAGKAPSLLERYARIAAIVDTSRDVLRHDHMQLESDIDTRYFPLSGPGFQILYRLGAFQCLIQYLIHCIVLASHYGS